MEFTRYFGAGQTDNVKRAMRICRSFAVAGGILMMGFRNNWVGKAPHARTSSSSMATVK